MSAIDWTSIENALQAWIAASVASAGIPAARVIWAQQDGVRPVSPWVSLKLWGLKPDGIGWIDVEDSPLTFSPIVVTNIDTVANNITAPAHGLNTGDGPVQVQSSGNIPGGLAALTDYWAIAIDVNTLRLATSFSDAIASVAVAVTDPGTGVVTIVSTADTVRAGQEINHVVRRYYSATLTIQCYADVTQPTGPLNAVALVHECQARSMLPSVRNALENAGCGVFDFGPLISNGEAINTTQFEPRAVVDARIWLTSQVSEPDTIIDNMVVTNTNSDEIGTVLPDVLITVP